MSDLAIATPGDLRKASWSERFQLSMAFLTPILAIIVVIGFRYVDTEAAHDSANDLKAARLAACDVANEYNEAVILTALTYSFTNGNQEALSPDDRVVLETVANLNAKRDGACRAEAATSD